MQQITARELADWLNDPARPAPLLLDVREPWEHAICSIAGSRLLPMGSVPGALATLDEEVPVVVVCHHGMRSLQVAMFLERQGFSAVFNLQGGVAAWADDVDPAMARY